MVWLSLSLVRCGLFLFGLEDDLNENAIVETWIKIIKLTLDYRESSGSAIQFCLRTCLFFKLIQCFPLKPFFAIYSTFSSCLALKTDLLMKLLHQSAFCLEFLLQSFF